MVYFMGVVRGFSLVLRMKTASSFAGSVLLALRLIEWIAPGSSNQLSSSLFPPALPGLLITYTERVSLAG